MKQPSLDNLQRWMQSVITHPAGVEAGLTAPAAQAHLEVAPAEVEQIIEPSHRQSSLERLAVYADAYYARLIECLQAEFPVFRHTVGDDAFAEFAVTYLQRYPSRSYTLGQLGAEFVRFLSETRPEPRVADVGNEAAANNKSNCDGQSTNESQLSAHWPDFLIDLARLERTVSEVFDGPGLERNALISNDELLAIDPNHWPQARLTAAPCLRLLALRFALNDYYTAVKGNKEAAIPPLKNSWLAITRRDYVVRRYELSRPQFVLLEALHRGETVGDSIVAAAEVYPGDIEQLACDLGQWFRTWVAAPMFERVVSGV